MKSVRSKLIFSLKAIAIIALFIGIVFSAYMKVGSKQIAQRNVNTIYTWKSGSLRTEGVITPEACSLTTSKCKCSLSVRDEKCVFNFNFEELNHNASIKVMATNFPPSLSSSVSEGCASNQTNQIFHCTVTYKWDKSKPISKNTQIVLNGIHGIQPLINLQIEAK